MLIDLQLHSTYSDGYLAPSQLASFLNKQGVKIASLTDHNTIRGQGEFQRACKKFGIKYIPGIELYASLNHKSFNVLWFNFDDSPKLHEILRLSQIRRKNKVRGMLLELRKQRFDIDVESTLDQFNHYVPINRIIDNILDNPANRKIVAGQLKSRNPREEDIIKEYFFNNHRSVLRESYIDIHHIIELRKELGGKLVVNHPGKHNNTRRPFLAKLRSLGIDGIEVLSPHHSISAVLYYQYLARDLDLIETGGSDFHRFEGNGFPIQHSWQYFKIDSKYLRGVEKIIGKK